MQFSNIFVCEDTTQSTYEMHVAAPLFRKSVFFEQIPQKAQITICGLGFYDLFVNGRKITKGYLAPYVSNPDHMVYYDNYNIEEYLVLGENVIGVMLGDGFISGKTIVWDFKDNIFNSSPKLALCAEFYTKEGYISFEADSMSCKKGPVTFNDVRSGIFYDKRLEEKGWNSPGFLEDSTWHEPILADRPRGAVKLCEAEPIVVTREIKPVKIYKGSLKKYEPRDDVKEWLENIDVKGTAPERSGGWIYDFGENNAGIFRLKINAEKGQKIDIQCAEIEKNGELSYSNINFFPDGYAQRDIYIADGDGEEIFEPMFVYHGFRYLYVSGITSEQATEELLTYLVMSSALEDRGGFECSDEMANKIFEMCHRSDVSNFHYFPTDCPHREKNGWTGDASLSAEHMIMTIGAENSWREWMNNIRKAQDIYGRLPGIVPTDTWGYTWGNGPSYDCAIFEIPYQVYKYRGDTKMIEENAHAMLSYIEYISRKRDKDGIIAVGLGDWLPVHFSEEAYQVPLGFTDSVIIYDICKKSEIMFGAIGLTLHKEFAKKLGAELYDAIREKYIDFNNMTVEGNCQSSQAMGIYYGIFTPAESRAAFAELLRIIHRDGDEITSGTLGIRVIFHVLAQFSEADLAYEMITRPDAPSYARMVLDGETTMPEHFLHKNMSHNHHFFGDIINWFMRYPGGINVKDSKSVVIKPIFLKKLQSASARHELPDGTVSVKWQKCSEGIILEVECPESVQCDIKLEGDYFFKESGRSYVKCKGHIKAVIE